MLVCLVAARARGAASGHVAISIEGPSGERLRTELVSALPAGIELTDESKLTSALSRERVASVSSALHAPRKRKTLIAKMHKAARAIGADAVILGAVPPGKGRGGVELQLIVVRVSRKGAVVDETVRFAKGASRADRWRSLLGRALIDLRAGAAPVAVEDTKDEEDSAGADQGAADQAGGAPESTSDSNRAKKGKAKEDGEEGSGAQDSKESAESEQAEAGGTTRDHASPADAFIVAFGGLDLGGRQFHYNQRVTNDNLRPFDLPSVLLPASPGGALSVEIYPLARTSRGWMGDLGVTAGGRYNLAKAQIGTATLSTQWYAWDVNLRGRMPLGNRGADAPNVGLQLGLGEQVFAFKGGAADVDKLPGVDYRYLRIGADGRIPLGKVDILLAAAFRHLLNDGGTVGKHFPRATLAGLDATLGGAVRIMNGLEARVALNYVRFWATLNPRPTDTYIAGGALEQMVHLDLGVAAFF